MPEPDVSDAEDTELLDPAALKDEDVLDPEGEDVEELTPTADQSLRYFGADYEVDVLVKPLRAGDLTIPSFVRERATGDGYAGFRAGSCGEKASIRLSR